jgi:hypothetical protein
MRMSRVTVVSRADIHSTISVSLSATYATYPFSRPTLMLLARLVTDWPLPISPTCSVHALFKEMTAGNYNHLIRHQRTLNLFSFLLGHDIGSQRCASSQVFEHRFSTSG